MRRRKIMIYLCDNGDIEIIKVYDFIVIQFEKYIKTVKTINEVMPYLVKAEYDGICKQLKAKGL